MKRKICSIITIGLLSCNATEQKDVIMDGQNPDLETVTFEGITIDFKFNSDKPSFGDFFLIVGRENPNFPSNSSEFEKLQYLGIVQVDDYFGIRNTSEIGDDVTLWLYPLKNGEAIRHKDGLIDAIRLSYIILRNDIKTAEIFEETFKALTENLNVTPFFNGQPLDNFEKIRSVMNEAVQYCRLELKVEPGSDEALQLEW